MIDTNSAKQRINQLIELDKNTDKEFDNEYSSLMNYIEKNVYAFINKYADENGMTVTQASQNVSQWDIKQLKNAIQQIGLESFSDNAKQRVDVIAKQAGINKGNLLNSIVGLGLINFTDNQINSINERVSSDGIQQIKFLSKELGLNKQQSDILNNSDLTDDSWQDSFWMASDGIRNNTENTINVGFRTGITQIALGTLFALHSRDKDKRPNKSIADRIHQLVSSSGGYVRTTSSVLINKYNKKAYNIKGYKNVRWQTEPGVCSLCASISRSGPYELDNSPIPGMNSHPNCRCFLVPINSEGNDD